ncbi:uncharacterized protein [Pagrus major]|uniref:uncharacterized protein n=1 Tax=Pagrus major TaxID=143350 RepID=UPI003CC8D9D5
MATESAQATLGPTTNNTSLPTQTKSTSVVCHCLSTATPATDTPTLNPSSSSPALGLLTIKWMRECEGDIHLNLSHPSSSSPVCNNDTKSRSLLGNVCQNKKGCEGKPSWRESKTKKNGSYFTESGAVDRRFCKTLRVHCTELPDVQGQLQAYKVVSALLCLVLLVLLLIRFTRPTVKALQKRLSDRRQNRWIGPTQSHSVSYHRGKTAVKNNDGEKRHSYPALERLAVNDSREPSSNRNSDYNF